MKARVRPMTPSPRFSLPSPVSQAESITRGEPRRRLKISSVRKNPSWFLFPTRERTTPVNWGRSAFSKPCVAICTRRYFPMSRESILSSLASRSSQTSACPPLDFTSFAICSASVRVPVRRASGNPSIFVDCAEETAPCPATSVSALWIPRPRTSEALAVVLAMFRARASLELNTGSATINMARPADLPRCCLMAATTEADGA